MVVTGVIRPPPEIRAVADRTALYVAKNGRAFETKILNSAKGQTPRFAFLQTTSPFHAYYEEKIQFYENGGTDEKENAAQAKKKQEEADAKKKKADYDDNLQKQRQKQKATSGAMIDPVAKALLTQRNKISEMRALQEQQAKAAAAATAATTTDSSDTKPAAETSRMLTAQIPAPPALPLIQMVAPNSLTVVQLEVMQAVAQFVALSSTCNVNLLQQLSVREWSNPAFAFCQPRHGHFPYFSALVDAYKMILQQHWNNSNNNNSNDPVPKLAGNVQECLQAAAYRAEYERDQEMMRRKNQDDEAPVAKIDWYDFVVVETIDFAVDEVVFTLPPPPPPPPPPVSEPTAAAASKAKAKPASEDAMDVSDDEESDDDNKETIRVVPSYTPKVVASGAAHTMETVIDPITGKSVAVKDMPEHMRIQLLDPKWAEERLKFQQKQKESNLVSGDVVAANLERFAQARGDRFGKKEQDLLSQEAESKKRLDEANRIIREQQQQQQPTTLSSQSVGPSLPRKEPPTSATSGTATLEPAAKRPKITYAPSVLAAQQQQQQQQEQAATATSEGGAAAATLPPLPPPPPPPPVEEDPFAAAVTGALPVTTTAGAAAAPSSASQELIPEAEFAAAHPQVTLQVRVPNDPAQMAWNFYGQIVSVTASSMDKVKQVKAALSSTHLNGMPVSKIQLRKDAGTFLKDAASLAALNIGPTATVELVPRSRGGKKK